MSLRAKRNNLVAAVVIVLGLILAPAVWAQESDDSSSTTTTTTTDGTSSKPATARDQVGLTYDPLQQLGDRLIRVFNFDNATKQWTFYDPRPEFADVNTLNITQIAQGEIYWIRVSADTTLQLDADSVPIPLMEGWNMLVR